jgi:hypothetical protein
VEGRCSLHRAGKGSDGRNEISYQLSAKKAISCQLSAFSFNYDYKDDYKAISAQLSALIEWR